jgi:Kdo2-lipid IVA lauroyltransferase/acyltransferase
MSSPNPSSNPSSNGASSASPSSPSPPAPRAFRHRIELALFLAVRGVLLALPVGWARPLGAGLGILVWLAGARRRIVMENLALAFPDWTPRRRRQVARACYRHFGAMLCESVAFTRIDPVELCRRLTLEGWQRLDEAEAHGRGLLVFGGHTGNWEIAARVLGLYRAPYHIVVRPFNNPRVYAYMARDRERFGIREVGKRGAARQLFRVVREGGRVGLAMDQRVRPGQGLELPFFGRPALVTPLPASISLRTGAPAVPIFAWPEPGGSYRVEVGEPILPPAGFDRRSGEDEETAVAALTARYLAALEEAIRRHPEQWLWMHRRWRLD